MKKNSVSQISFLAIFVLLLALVGSATTIAQEPDTNQDDVVDVTITAGQVFWRPQIESGGYTLSISGPGGFYRNQTYRPGDHPVFRVEDSAGQALPAGVYQYEFRFVSSERPVERDDSARGLAPAAQAPGKSGSFSILNGRFVLQDEAEDMVKEVRAPEGVITPNDQVILDDLIVDGSLCVGMDCVNGESFGFDTQRLKENNLRIHFQDTSATASFPTTDWRIVINDSANGGANYFAIEDSDASRHVFKVEAGAPSNALYVDDYGRVGLGTSTPVVELEIAEGDTPTVRLNQDGSSGWTPQTWDVAGNEANFFIRDATNGSQLPFRIQPGADSNALTIRSDNKIGVGTWSPDAEVDIESNTSPGFRLTNTGTAGGSWDLFMNSNTGRFNLRDNSTGNIPFKLDQGTDENLIQLGVNNADEVTINGNLVVTGQCTEADGACAPDYVFAPEYKMLTLAELEAYIDANAHLPNVPSGTELDANGINVQEFNYLLLEKIEELTLYTLLQQETIEALEARLAALEGK